jgi:hypothetical protein
MLSAMEVSSTCLCRHVNIYVTVGRLNTVNKYVILLSLLQAVLFKETFI